MRTLSILFFFATANAFAQDGCPPLRFASTSSAALLPTPNSHRVLAKQPDGSFTAFDLSNTSPYNLLHTVPHFDQQLRPCTPSGTGLGVMNVAVGQPKAGGYLVAIAPQATIQVASYDANFNVTGQAQVFLPGGVPYSIQFADVNNDGNLDIVVYAEPDLKNEIAIFLSSGGTNFQAPTILRLPDGPINGVQVADINGDGKPDIAGIANSAQEIFAFPGNGDGTFGALTVVVPSAYSAVAFAVADVTGDGVPDLVLANGVEAGLGKGSHATLVPFPVATRGPLAIGDLNGDGFPDIVTGSGSPSVIVGDTTTVLFGTGLFGKSSGAFAAPPLVQVPGVTNGSNIRSMVSGDFNNDGIPDLAVAGEEDQVSVLLGAGNGTFSTSFAKSLSNAVPFALRTADFNRDGHLDIAVATGGGSAEAIAILLGNGDGSFQTASLTNGNGAVDLAIGDFNGDGKPDLALLPPVVPLDYANSVEIFFGNGDGSFTAGPTYPAAPGAVAILAADFTGDGKLDLMISSQGTADPSYYANAGLTLFVGKGDGTFTTQSPIALGSPYHLSPIGLIAADFNHDGKLDLAPWTTAGFFIMFGSGNGTFGAPVLYSGSGPLIAGDLNNDGIPDLFAGSGYRLGNGDGTFQAPVSAGIGNPFVLADFNGDGKLDLASALMNTIPSGLAVQINTSQPQPAVAIISAASLAPGLLEPGSIVTAYGSSAAPVTVQDSTGAQLPATVLYASASQYNFVLPSNLDAGPATVSFGSSVSAPVVLTPVAPQTFAMSTAGLAAAYESQVTPSGAIAIQLVFTVQNGIATPVLIDTSIGPTYLTFFATGEVGTLSSGALPNGFTVTYDGAAPGLLGVQQINLMLNSPQSGYTSLNLGGTPVYIVIK